MKLKNKITLIISVLFICSCSKSPVKEITIDKTNKLLKQQTNTTIINVDPFMEYNISHINGDINIDVLAMGFSDKISMLEKTNTYIVYSKIKLRAVNATDIMIKQGFSNVYMINAEYTNIVDQVMK